MCSTNHKQLVAKMQTFNSATVFLLCLILGNWDKLAAATDKFEDEELQLAAVVDSVETLYKLFGADEQKLLEVAGKSKGFSFTQEKKGNSKKSAHQYYIIHGWKGNQFEQWIDDTAAGILKHNDTRVIRFDWSDHAALEYFYVVKLVKTIIGKKLADHLVEKYNDGNLDLDKLTLIGHGLGAHVAGIAGKLVFKELGKKVRKIVAPSPAGPGFNIASSKNKLQSDDALCVVVLHTDRIFFGYHRLIGGLDFSANGGYLQPGCILQLFKYCSHKRSTLYLAEAYNKVRSHVDVARASEGLKHFIHVLTGDCKGGNGHFSFSTRKEPPFIPDPNLI